MEVAEALGLAAGIPGSGGGGDNRCAGWGGGAVDEGAVVVSLGASGTAFSYRSEPAIDPRGEAAAFCDSTGGWLPMGVTLNCTNATEWIRGLFGLDHAAVDAAIASDRTTGLTFLPFLSGERTPNRPEPPGLVVGLRASHGREAIVQAVVEGGPFGLAYQLA